VLERTGLRLVSTTLSYHQVDADLTAHRNEDSGHKERDTVQRFLVDQCYLVGNPWNGVTVPKATRVGVARGRSFTQAQWTFIERRAAQLSDISADRRLRFAPHLF